MSKNSQDFAKILNAWGKSKTRSNGRAFVSINYYDLNILSFDASEIANSQIDDQKNKTSPEFAASASSAGSSAATAVSTTTSGFGASFLGLDFP